MTIDFSRNLLKYCPPAMSLRNILIVIQFLLLVFCFQSVYAKRINVTDQITYIGNPFFGRYPMESQRYARNVWDMISFGGKLYLGAGNSSNAGPIPNAGPVPIIRYDPEINSFSTVFIADEEQVDVFYNFNNQLYVPGHDSRGGWEFGSFYSFSSEDGWQKHRTIPDAVHTYSLTNYRNKLFAALGTQGNKSLAESDDDGKTWQQYAGSRRMYAFLQMKNKLYATGVFFSEAILTAMAKNQSAIPVSCYEYIPGEGFKPRPDLSKASLFFPNSLPQNNKTYKISRSLFIKDKTIFIGSEIHNDHQSLPFGVFVASTLETGSISIESIRLPQSSTPWDILQDGESVYILLEHFNKKPREISVITSSDLETWSELFYFQMTTFARSFAKLNNSLYFSAGGEVRNPWNWQQSEISPDTGTIYKVVLPQ